MTAMTNLIDRNITWMREYRKQIEYHRAAHNRLQNSLPVRCGKCEQCRATIREMKRVGGMK